MRIVLLILCCLLIYAACSKEDITLNGVEYSGTVIGFDGCNSPSGLYHKVDIEHDEELDFIRTNSLPDSLSNKGLKIRFKLKESKDSLQVCQQNIGPPFHFYEVYDVALQ